MIVLDTHVLVWWVNGHNQLSEKAQMAIDRELVSETPEIRLSSITAWEIAMLVDRGRLALTMDVEDWLNTAEAIEGVAFVPVNNDIAINSVRLPGTFHKDPADRLIVSLARHLSSPLVTGDQKIINYKHVKTIW